MSWKDWQPAVRPTVAALGGGVVVGIIEMTQHDKQPNELWPFVLAVFLTGVVVGLFVFVSVYHAKKEAWAVSAKEGQKQADMIEIGVLREKLNVQVKEAGEAIDALRQKLSAQEEETSRARKWYADLPLGLPSHFIRDVRIKSDVAAADPELRVELDIVSSTGNLSVIENKMRLDFGSSGTAHGSFSNHDRDFDVPSSIEVGPVPITLTIRVLPTRLALGKLLSDIAVDARNGKAVRMGIAWDAIVTRGDARVTISAYMGTPTFWASGVVYESKR